MDAILDKNNIAIQAGDITIYNYDGATREYIFTAVEYLPVGIGIPAHSCTDAPPTPHDGQVICRSVDDSEWKYVADHRGETVYSTKTGIAIEIAEPGDYPAATTTLAPATPYDRWNGNEWITDVDAQRAADVAAAEQQKTALTLAANSAIAPLQDAVDLGIATDEELALLLEWKKYRVLLNRIDTSVAPDIEWPTVPGERAS